MPSSDKKERRVRTAPIAKKTNPKPAARATRHRRAASSSLLDPRDDLQETPAALESADSRPSDFATALVPRSLASVPATTVARLPVPAIPESSSPNVLEQVVDQFARSGGAPRAHGLAAFLVQNEFEHNRQREREREREREMERERDRDRERFREMERGLEREKRVLDFLNRFK